MIPTSLRVVLTLLFGGLVILAVMVGRVALLESRQPDVEPADVAEVRDGAVERLGEAVRIRTISPQDFDREELRPFRKFREALTRWFPTVHETLEREQVGPCSLLYRWEGRKPAERPALWLSHTDVVPAEEPEDWRHGPFSGAVADGYVWGRGTLDVKSGVMGILEAAETLAASGFRPDRTVRFAFGCDEEVGGRRGARRIASLLAERDVRPSYVLDEGHAITDGLVSGVERPVALVGIAERGYATFELRATGTGGHSSMPPKSTAIGELADAVSRVEANPMPARLNRPTRRMLETLAPEVPIPRQFVLGNLWLFEPVVLRTMTGKSSTNAAVRTTAAVTMIDAGTRENVLPGRATATVNYRIAPDDRIRNVREHLERIVGDGISVRRPESAFGSNPSPLSSTTSEAFRTIRKNVRSVFGEEMLVAPALTLGATDSRYYTDITADTYRFLPAVLGPGDPDRIHGKNERLGVENYRKLVRFYIAMLRDL